MGVNKAYLAGLIDGEGCLTISHGANGFYRPHLEVWNTKLWVLEKIGVERAVQLNIRKARGNQKRCGVIHFYDKKLLKLLKDIFPYLLIKRRQANLLLRFYKATSKETNHRIANLIRKANKRGNNTDVGFSLSSYPHSPKNHPGKMTQNSLIKTKEPIL